MEDKQAYFKNPTNRLEKETFLMNYKYLSGQALPGEEDFKYMQLMQEAPDKTKYPNLFYWRWSLYPFSVHSRDLWLIEKAKMSESNHTENDSHPISRRSMVNPVKISEKGKWISLDVFIESTNFSKKQIEEMALNIKNNIKISTLEWSNDFKIDEKETGRSELKLEVKMDRMEYFKLSLNSKLVEMIRDVERVRIQEKKNEKLN